MGAQEDVERQPLVAPTVPDTILGSQPTGHAAMTLPNNAQLGNREWDGGLMSCCGNCDPEGVSTCAYVKYCTPFAWGHNMKRAFNASFWKHALAFFFFFGLWAWLYLTLVVQAGVYCAKPGPGGWLQPQPFTPPELNHHPEKTFLGGATWQPEKFEPLFDPTEEPKAPKKAVNKPAKPAAQSENPYSDFEEKAEEAAEAARKNAEKLSKHAEQNAEEVQEKNKQLAKDAVEATQQAAKIAKEKSDQVVKDLTKDVPDEILQAKQNLAEGLAQLNAKLGVGNGRRLLHKHDDDDDEHDKKKGGKNKKNKKDGKKDGKKDSKKKNKKGGKKGDKKHDDKEMEALKPVGRGQPGHPDFYPSDENPRCVEAVQNLWAMRLVMYFAVFLGALYAAGKRTALRERFGIAGSPLKDKLAWLLCPLCALCQETRTLAANNVRGGTWFGPTALAVPANPLQAPTPLVAEAPAKKAEAESAKPTAEV